MRYKLIAAAVGGLMVMACGQANGHTAAGVSSTPLALASTSPRPAASSSPTTSSSQTSPSTATAVCTTPQPLPDLCVGRAATQGEAKEMITVGMAGAEAALHLQDFSQCQTGDFCLKEGDPLRVMVGTDAGVFNAGNGALQNGSLTLGSFCVIFVNYASGSWHYLASACAQNPGFFPGPQDHVYVQSGCANVRSEASLTSQVVACLGKDTLVDVDSAPVYKDGLIWWHLANGGWMANDFLIQPH